MSKKRYNITPHKTLQLNAIKRLLKFNKEELITYISNRLQKIASDPPVNVHADEKCYDFIIFFYEDKKKCNNEYRKKFNQAISFLLKEIIKDIYDNKKIDHKYFLRVLRVSARLNIEETKPLLKNFFKKYANNKVEFKFKPKENVDVKETIYSIKTYLLGNIIYNSKGITNKQILAFIDNGGEKKPLYGYFFNIKMQNIGISVLKYIPELLNNNLTIYNIEYLLKKFFTKHSPEKCKEKKWVVSMFKKIMSNKTQKNMLTPKIINKIQEMIN